MNFKVIFLFAPNKVELISVRELEINILLHNITAFISKLLSDFIREPEYCELSSKASS